MNTQDEHTRICHYKKNGSPTLKYSTKTNAIPYPLDLKIKFMNFSDSPEAVEFAFDMSKFNK